ncbi:MAG: M48 family metallopeptidase [Pseudomonadota bacterium]
MTPLFLALLAATTIVRLWLSSRQIAAVRRGRERVPAPFDDTISLEQHHKAADYTMATTRLSRVGTLVDAILLLLWTLGGGLMLVHSLVSALSLGPLLTGTLVTLLAFIAMSALELPLAIWRTFRIEARFGFNRMTPSLFISDQLKSLVLMAVLGTPMIAVVLWLMAAAGSLWWLYAWVVWVAFSLALFYLYPAFIAPLFNRFTELTDAGLKAQIESLLQRCGFKSQGVFVMDGSRRSSHGNAYFTGMGNNKRIVFFDTLLESLNGQEIEAVLAHELGHFRRQHVRKRLMKSFAMTLVGLALIGWLRASPDAMAALGITVPTDALALLLALVISPVFTFPMTPITAALSRRDEFEADEYAAEQSDPTALIEALVKLYRDNSNTLTPDETHSRFYDSHPPAPIRIARLSQLANSR